MIRYIAVTAVKNDEEVIHIPETLIENISKIDNGRAEIVYRELREDDISEAYSSATDWRITGYASEKAYSVMKFEDLIDWLNGVQRPIVDLGNMTPEEREAFQDNLVAARRALRTIDKGTTLQPSGQIGIESDVWALIKLLNDREYAEHWATSALGKDLEEEITELVGHDNAATSRLQRAEELLAEVWHEWNNDDATRKALGDDMGNVIGSFLYPDRTNC